MACGVVWCVMVRYGMGVQSACVWCGAGNVSCYLQYVS